MNSENEKRYRFVDGVILLVLWGFVLMVPLAIRRLAGVNIFQVGMIGLGYLIALAVLFVATVLYAFVPRLVRHCVAGCLISIANRRGEVVQNDEVEESLDCKYYRISPGELSNPGASNSSGDCKDEGEFLDLIQRIDPGARSKDDFFTRVSEDGGAVFRKRLRPMILDGEKGKRSQFRLLYEMVFQLDRKGCTQEDAVFRLENLLSLEKDEFVRGNDLDDFVLYSLCRAAYNLDKYDIVVRYASRTIRVMRTSACDADTMGIVLDIVGSAYVGLKEFSYAIPYLKAACKTLKDPCGALFRLAYLYFTGLREYSNALVYAQKCFAAIEDSGDLGKMKGFEEKLIAIIVYSAAASYDYQTAYETLDNYLKGHSDLDFKACKAYLGVKLGEINEARLLVEDVLKNDPGNATALNAKGIIAIADSEYALGSRCFLCVIDVFSKDQNNSAQRYYFGEICNNLAYCEMKCGREASAKEWFKRSFDCGFPDVDVEAYSDLVC